MTLTKKISNPNPSPKKQNGKNKIKLKAFRVLPLKKGEHLKTPSEIFQSLIGAGNDLPTDLSENKNRR